MSAIKGVPHPFPYQGSKRQQATQILACIPEKVATLYEPFAGSAAISIAAAYTGRAKRFVINDSHEAVADLWTSIVIDPSGLCAKYRELWNAQLGNKDSFYNEVRDKFNKTHEPHFFLYLLARCVKAAVRYNQYGEFNNSPDKRRLGMKPENMKRNIDKVSRLLSGRTEIMNRDYTHILLKAKKGDLVYMDPPYQGVCDVRDNRYHSGIDYDEFAEALSKLCSRGVDFIVSYDGRTGDKVHGKELPSSLGLNRLEIVVGRSTQSTLLGRNDVTVESIYLSPSLLDKVGGNPILSDELPLLTGCI